MSKLQTAVPTKNSSETSRYILLTQCMQNDFFLNRECNLRLPDSEVGQLLVGGANGGRLKKLQTEPGGNRVKLGKKVKNGPLGLFLKAIIDPRRSNKDGRGVLHIINIRDWHKPGPEYDRERRKYGAHCEKGSWGSDYIQGLEEYFDPARDKASRVVKEGEFFRQGTVRIYHIHSNTIFDFKPRYDPDGSRYSNKGKFLASELEYILDLITLGREDHLDKLAQILKQFYGPDNTDARLEAIDNLFDEVRQENTKQLANIYVAVIGVYTDIKVITLLAGLHSRYNIPNLAVSDTLTKSPSLERHLNALDFAQKVLDVEVIHGLNNLARFLGSSPTIDNERDIVMTERFSTFSSYFQDKQNVLAYETERLKDYIYLTQNRAEEVYTAINRSNKFLLAWGTIFLTLTLVGAILNLILPDLFSWQPLAITGGLSLIQLVTVYFRRPMKDLQNNLTNLAIFRMVLESHSLKTALARYHLTTPQTLREEIELDASVTQVIALQEQIAILERIEAKDYEALTNLGFTAGDAANTSEQ